MSLMIIPLKIVNVPFNRNIENLTAWDQSPLYDLKFVQLYHYMPIM